MTSGAELRVLLLSRHGRKGASSRVRSHQYVARLEDEGIRVDASPLLPDRYLEEFYREGSKPQGLAVRRYGRRLVELAAAGRYDLVWIEKELFPWLPAWAERALARLGVPYLADYDDARFHRYDRHPSFVVRRLLGGKMDAVMRRASLVTVGNQYLEDRARRAGATPVRQIPSGVDLKRYPDRPAAEPGTNGEAPFTVGWIGTPFTARYLQLVADPLQALTEGGGAKLVAVGAGDKLPASADAEVRSWSEETEVEELLSFDVGIMPLPDRPFERGKCAYKAVQYMAAGRPVVASPVGAAPEVVEPGETGFLAETGEEWTRALRRLREEPALCRRMGWAGRRRVEKRYAANVLAPRLAGALREAAGAAPAGGDGP